MPAPRRVARAIAVAGAAVLVVTLVPAVSSAYRVPGPIHAGNTFGWYRDGVWRQEFKGRKPAFWHKRGRGTVRTQHGMLTLNTTRRGDVSATLDRRGHRTGRWEIRLRAKRYEYRHTNYRVVTELVPSGGRDQHCGGKDVALENFKLGQQRVKFYIHTLPQNTFHSHLGRNLHNDRWHTYAVEVTRHHISWFVDAKVIRTERRDVALSGVPLTMRFAMRATPGHRMNQSRMQMDWMRYWSADSPNKKSIRAPHTRRGVYRAAC